MSELAWKTVGLGFPCELGAGLSKRSLAAKRKRSGCRADAGRGPNNIQRRFVTSALQQTVCLPLVQLPCAQLVDLRSCTLNGEGKEKQFCNVIVTFQKKNLKAGIELLAAELPPPYTAIASPDASGVPVINCRVCQSLINLDGKLHQHVVKCTVCNEATPIKNPPAGKKYVRCQCNCLLICKDTSRKIGCPRPNCRRIITLGPVMLIPEEQPAQPALPVQPDGTRVVCGHCGNTFLWMELRFNTLAKCPHCKKISSVGSALPRRRCCAYITIGMICIFIGVGLTVGTQDFARRFHATYVSWAIAYLLGLICLIRACYWGAIKVSYPEHSFA
ncbi:PREDICTED: type 2 phosphatidylinositol 4,5-bisphosphate 4-phosphatase-like [Apaloderma vittatum]|nr:PREDICTED: type 2 phosphatidylinositol 4,5-bisphosphate 4-phosphatase-like [Apaloderma vittatum]